MRDCLKALIIATILLIAVTIGAGTGSASPEDDYFYPEIDDSITVTGEVSKIIMAEYTSPKYTWKELIITPSEGERYVLIGSMVEQLWNLNGTKIVTLSGLLKPKMRVQGNLTKALEVHYIGKIEDIKDGSPSN